MRWVVLLCTCTAALGCRQLLDIEEGRVTVEVGHDEDGDGVDDGLDNCPADANPTQTDSEARIGTICDPHPDEDGDRIALFLSFYPDGRPGELRDESEASFEGDVATVTNAEVKTREAFTPSVVTSSMMFGQFADVGSFVELSVGARRCRIAPCNSRICLFVENESTMASMMFTPTSVEATVALVQSDTQLACVLATQGLVVSLPQTTTMTEGVSVAVNDATMLVQNIVIYDVP